MSALEVRPMHAELLRAVIRELEAHGKCEFFAFAIAATVTRKVLGFKAKLFGVEQQRMMLAMGLAAAVIDAGDCVPSQSTHNDA